ncbi:NADH dehydrogenase [ubiquinone] 1 beta subcomplex subunit 4-like [Glandiceps talaboti]
MADRASGVTAEVKRAEFERTEIRHRLRREFQRKLHNPYIEGTIEDAAVLRWSTARADGYNYFKATPKTSFMGIFWIIGPPLALYTLFRYDRRRRQELNAKGIQRVPPNLISG